jgi:hypothetical protein
MQKAIINRNLQFGTLDGVIMENSKILKIIIDAIKKNAAQLVIDTNETLMYNLQTNQL